MNYGPTINLADAWMDLDAAADFAGVSYSELVDAVTHRYVRATTGHPQRPGDWMVPMVDVQAWAQRPQPARLVVLASTRSGSDT